MIKYWIAISFIFSSVLNLTAQNLVETLTSTIQQVSMKMPGEKFGCQVFGEVLLAIKFPVLQ